MHLDQMNKHTKEILKHGYTILPNLVPNDILDTLKQKMDIDLKTSISNGAVGSYGLTKGHLQLNPPPLKPYVFLDVIANKVICAITKLILGNDLVHCFYSGNTNMPNSETQKIHTDFGHLFKSHPTHPPANLIINLVFEDVNENNGATEIWPGSHHDDRFMCDFISSPDKKRVPDEVLEARRKSYPPIRLCLKKGDFVIRDPRLWHRGMPNNSTNPRHMMAMIHASAWVKTWGTIKFDYELKETLAKSSIQHNIEYTKETFNYLSDPFHGKDALGRDINYSRTYKPN